MLILCRKTRRGAAAGYSSPPSATTATTATVRPARVSLFQHLSLQHFSFPPLWSCGQWSRSPNSPRSPFLLFAFPISAFPSDRLQHFPYAFPPCSTKARSSTLPTSWPEVNYTRCAQVQFQPPVEPVSRGSRDGLRHHERLDMLPSRSEKLRRLRLPGRRCRRYSGGCLAISAASSRVNFGASSSRTNSFFTGILCKMLSALP
jgi:hypothetical protein